MLSIEAIRAIARTNGIKVRNHWSATTTDDVPPSLEKIELMFGNREAPEAWALLMSDLTEVPVTLWGTRQVTGSGATDDRLFPCYEALREAVNQKREAVGLAPVYG